MAIMNNNIAEKKYKKLSIQLTLNGLSFYSLDTLNNIPSAFTTIPIDVNQGLSFEEQVENIFTTQFNAEDFDSVNLIHMNQLFTAVPSSLFDKQHMNEYLKFSIKTLSIDKFAYDIIENHSIHNVYIPFESVNNIAKKHFKNVTYKHATSVLAKTLLDVSKNSYELQFYVHVQPTHFEIIITHKGKLELLNSFQYRTKEDFLYYILFVAEQLKLNPETFKLNFLGDITPEDELFKITYKYIRHVELIEPNMINNNDWNTNAIDYLKYFILLHS